MAVPKLECMPQQHCRKSAPCPDEVLTGRLTSHRPGVGDCLKRETLIMLLPWCGSLPSPFNTKHLHFDDEVPFART